MEQQTVTAKSSLTKQLKKHFNMPMLMLAIYSLTTFRSIFRAILTVVNCLLYNPQYLVTALPNMMVALFPLILLAFLWLHRFEKAKRTAWMGVLALLMAVLTGYAWYGRFISFFTNLPVNMYELMSVSPFLSILNTTLTILVYLFTGITLLLKKKNSTLFTGVLAIALATHFFFGILAQMTGDGSLISTFITAMYFIALFNTPKVVLEPRCKEIEKNPGLTALVVVVLLVYFISGAITGTLGGNSGNYGSSSRNTCRSCGRSWSAGDSGKNFMNIARTGMCNNCEDNFHSLEDFLD